MTTRYGRLFILLMAAVAAAFISCSGQDGKPSRETEKLRVGYLPIIPSLPLLLAHDSGTFERENIAVELVRFNTSNDVMSALLAEQIDVYFLASSSVTLLIEEQRPGFTKSFMVNANSRERPLDVLLARKGEGIARLKDLSGRKVGIFPGTTMKGFLASALGANGIPPQSVEFIELPPPEQIGALLTKRVDALLALEPIPTQALATGQVDVVSKGVVENYVINPWIGGTVTVRNEYLRSNRKTVEAFDRAVREVLPRVTAPDDENLVVLAKYTSITPEVARKVGFVDWLTLENIPREKFQELADKLLEVGVLKKKVDTSQMFF